jgi:putative salt-induced outer membrane protein YdiY
MTYLLRTAGSAVLMLLLLGIAPAVNADVLVLKNGDQITGEINRIWDGEIFIEPEYADEFDVDLSAVDHIISEREFEIDLEDGRELVATMGGEDSDGNQVLEVDGEAISIELEDFLEVDEPESFYDWETNVDLSSNLNKGNTDSSNTQLRSDAMFKHGDHRHRGELSFLREELADVSTKEQDRFNYSYNWLFNDPWFLAGNFAYESDPIILLDSRLTYSVGVGRDIWNTPQRFLSFNLGAGFQQEVTTDAMSPGLETTQDSPVATWALRFNHDFFSGDFELFHNQDISAQLDERKNTTFRTSTGIRYEITDLLYANFTFNYDYQTEPATGVKKEDIAILMGFGAEFE